LLRLLLLLLLLLLLPSAPSAPLCFVNHDLPPGFAPDSTLANVTAVLPVEAAPNEQG
jgi:hypothetical protein